MIDPFWLTTLLFGVSGAVLLLVVLKRLHLEGPLGWLLRLSGILMVLVPVGVLLWQALTGN